MAVLGANGFVGRAVVAALAQGGQDVRAVVRPGSARPFSPDLDVHEVTAGDWARALEGCEQVVHLIARTHRLGEHPGAETELAYRVVNVDLTRAVLAAARTAGVGRIVYMSSVKAMGESRERPYSEEDEPRPLDAYGRTKLAAEELVVASGLASVVLRPPLVHGPGAAGNVARLLQAVQCGLPLPLGRAHALRSLIAVTNLGDAVRHVVASEQAQGTYLVADPEPISVRGLVEALAVGCGRPPRLVPVPVPLLRAAGRVAGRADEVERLVLPLVLDTTRIRTELGWVPPLSTAEGLRLVAQA